MSEFFGYWPRALVAWALLAFCMWLASLTGGCAALKKDPGAVLTALAGCAPGIISAVISAVHTGTDRDWTDTAANALVGVDDAEACVQKIMALDAQAHGCAQASAAPVPATCTSGISDAEFERVVQLPAIARTAVFVRTKFTKPHGALP